MCYAVIYPDWPSCHTLRWYCWVPLFSKTLFNYSCAQDVTNYFKACIIQSVKKLCINVVNAKSKLLVRSFWHKSLSFLWSKLNICPLKVSLQPVRIFILFFTGNIYLQRQGHNIVSVSRQQSSDIPTLGQIWPIIQLIFHLFSQLW